MNYSTYVVRIVETPRYIFYNWNSISCLYTEIITTVFSQSNISEITVFMLAWKLKSNTYNSSSSFPASVKAKVAKRISLKLDLGKAFRKLSFKL